MGCWELDSNELINLNGLTVSNPGYLKTCQVKADKVDLICHPDRMEAQLAQCVVEGLTNFKLGSSVCTEDTTVDGLASTDPNGHDTAILNSDSCTNLESSGGTVGGIQDTNGCLYFNIKLDECSTQVNAVSDPNNPDDPALNYIEFTQQLSSEITETYQQEPNSPSVNLGNTLDSQFLALISSSPRVSIDFKCRYTQEYTTDSSAVATSPDDVTENLVSTGRFAYSLDTVQAVDSNGDPTFNLNNVVAWSTIHSTDPDDADAAYDVGKTLFFQIVPLASHQLEKATRSLMIIAQISLLILQERADGTMDISRPGPITRFHFQQVTNQSWISMIQLTLQQMNVFFSVTLFSNSSQVLVQTIT